MSNQFDIVGLGTAPIDIVSLVDHFPVGDEVQQAFELTVQGGGPVATAMVTLTRLGAKTAILDVVSDDWRGDLIRRQFERDGVCTDYLKLIKGATSALATIWVRRGDGARAIVYTPGTVPELAAKDVPQILIQSAQIIHLNGRHFDACLQACEYAHQNNVTISFDGGAHRYRPLLRQLVPLTDICIVARDFAERYTQQTEIQSAAQALLQEGPGLVVITDGVKGSWIYSQKGETFHQPAYLLPDVVDTTGCGDSYHGAFLLGLLRGLDLKQTAALASAVAALNSQHLGGRDGLPTLEQVTQFLATQAGVKLDLA